MYCRSVASDVVAPCTYALTVRNAALTPEQAHALPGPAREAFRAAVTHGLHGVAAGVAALSALAFVVAWFVREIPLDRATDDQGLSGPGPPDRP